MCNCRPLTEQKYTSTCKNGRFQQEKHLPKPFCGDLHGCMHVVWSKYGFKITPQLFVLFQVQFVSKVLKKQQRVVSWPPSQSLLSLQDSKTFQDIVQSHSFNPCPLSRKTGWFLWIGIHQKRIVLETQVHKPTMTGDGWPPFYKSI
jgi:hypothetical protein